MKVDTQYLEKTFERNMASFSKYLPDIFEYFKDYQESRFFLAYDANGDYNIFDSVDQKNIYDRHPMEFCAETYKDYEENPVLFSRLQGGAGEAAAQINPIHVSTTVKLANTALIVQNISSGRVKLPKKIKSMLFVGTGIGHDLEYIVNNKDIDNLVILEKNPDIFYATLFLVDWSSILVAYSSSEKNFSIIIDEDSNFLANQFFNKILEYGHHLANALFVYCPISLEKDKGLIDDVANIIKGRLMAGFGFYEDARYSIAATYENIKRKTPLYIKNNSLTEVVDGVGAPVFVVGNGPSLDKDISFIKNNIDKAIVISCGSAIKTLERNNIKPDIHVECERTAWTKSWLDQVDANFLKSINFIGLNVIYPDVFNLFDRSGMIAKTGETGSFILAEALQRLKGEPSLPLHSHVNPSVAHMGIGVTPFFGFRKFYLFGVDMGYESAEYHHSKDSSYSDLKENFQEKFSPKSSASFPVEANFGKKEMLTNTDFVSFRVFMEGMIELNQSFFGKNYECYNCSDGAYIKFAKPLEERNFADDWPIIDKEKVMSRIMNDHFDPSVSEEVYPFLDNIIEEDKTLVRRACDRMAAHFRSEIGSVEEADALIDSAIEKLFHSKDTFSDDKAYLLTLFSGSLLYFFSTMTRILYFRVDNEKLKVDAANNGFKSIAEFFEMVSEDFEVNCLKNDSMEFHSGFFVDE